MSNTFEHNIDLPKFSPLDYDPFEGDFGVPGDIVFSDAIVKGRKKYACFHCGGIIAIGEIHRSRREKSDGEVKSFRWCAECCDAMVKELECDCAEDASEDMYPFENRFELKAKQ